MTSAKKFLTSGFIAGPSSSGGTEEETNNYMIHTFTNETSSTDGDFTLLKPTSVEILMVGGGGGGGGGRAGGGGGAGSIFYLDQSTATFRKMPAGTYKVTVGAGGTQNNPGGNTVVEGLDGQLLYAGDPYNRPFYTIAPGGGRGGGGEGQTTNGGNGGSGGGGGFKGYRAGGGHRYNPHTGVNLGNNGLFGAPGGRSSGSNYIGGGGGGGAVGNGGNTYRNPRGGYIGGGAGGAGKEFAISGTAKHYAGGGGGRGQQYSTGTGGIGGGGNGGSDGGGQTAGTAQTGGGGGANRSGGSGIVIFKYKIDPAANPDGSALAPFESPVQAQLYGATSGQVYYFLYPSMTGPNNGSNPANPNVPPQGLPMEYQSNYYEGKPWVKIFSSEFNGSTTLVSIPGSSTSSFRENWIGYSVPMDGLLVQRSTLDHRAAVYFNASSPRTLYNYTTGIIADSGYSYRKVMLGSAGGHGIYSSNHNVCSFDNDATGAIGAGRGRVGYCGTFPNNLLWGTGTNTGASLFENRSGTWEHWVTWDSSRTNAQNGLYQTPLSIFDQRGKGSLHITILTSFDQRGEGSLHQTPLAVFDQRGKGVLHSTTLTSFDQRGEGSLHSTSSTLTSFDQRGEGALHSTDADSIP